VNRKCFRFKGESVVKKKYTVILEYFIRSFDLQIMSNIENKLRMGFILTFFNLEINCLRYILTRQINLLYLTADL